MNETIKKHVSDYNESEGWGTGDAALLETIVDSKVVWEGKRDEHRWYTLIPTVTCINGMFLMHTHCHTKGEATEVSDCIGGYKLAEVVEVVSKEATVTIYEPKEDAGSEESSP